MLERLEFPTGIETMRADDPSERDPDKAVAIYHIVYAHESFEETAQNLFKLIRRTRRREGQRRSATSRPGSLSSAQSDRRRRAAWSLVPGTREGSHMSSARATMFGFLMISATIALSSREETIASSHVRVRYDTRPRVLEIATATADWIGMARIDSIANGRCFFLPVGDPIKALVAPPLSYHLHSPSLMITRTYFAPGDTSCIFLNYCDEYDDFGEILGPLLLNRIAGDSIHSYTPQFDGLWAATEDSLVHLVQVAEPTSVVSAAILIVGGEFLESGIDDTVPTFKRRDAIYLRVDSLVVNSAQLPIALGDTLEIPIVRERGLFGAGMLPQVVGGVPAAVFLRYESGVYCFAGGLASVWYLHDGVAKLVEQSEECPSVQVVAESPAASIW